MMIFCCDFMDIFHSIFHWMYFHTLKWWIKLFLKSQKYSMFKWFCVIFRLITKKSPIKIMWLFVDNSKAIICVDIWLFRSRKSWVNSLSRFLTNTVTSNSFIQLHCTTSQCIWNKLCVSISCFIYCNCSIWLINTFRVYVQHFYISHTAVIYGQSEFAYKIHQLFARE